MSTAAWLHPLAGVLAVALTVWLMSRGLGARRGGSHAHIARRAHKRWAWRLFGLMLVVFVSGVASTVWLRPDLASGASLHARIGGLAVALMALTGALSRRFRRGKSWKTAHLAVGMVLIVVLLWQAMLGMELMP